MIAYSAMEAEFMFPLDWQYSSILAEVLRVNAGALIIRIVFWGFPCCTIPCEDLCTQTRALCCSSLSPRFCPGLSDFRARMCRCTQGFRTSRGSGVGGRADSITSDSRTALEHVISEALLLAHFLESYFRRTCCACCPS